MAQKAKNPADNWPEDPAPALSLDGEDPGPQESPEPPRPPAKPPAPAPEASRESLQEAFREQIQEAMALGAVDFEVAEKGFNFILESRPLGGTAVPKALMAKLARILTDLEWIEKRGWNDFHRYWYATEADIMAAIRPRLGALGIFCNPIIQEEGRAPTGKKTAKGAVTYLWRIRIRAVFFDSDSGESLETHAVGYSEDDTDKGYAKAYTGAMKFLFGKMFQISTGDDPEMESDEGKGKGKKSPPPAPNAGPRSVSGSGNPIDGEGAEFEVIAQVMRHNTSEVGNGRTQYKFELPDQMNCTTIDKKLAEKVLKEKGTGIELIWRLRKKGSFTNLVSVDYAPPPDGA